MIARIASSAARLPPAVQRASSFFVLAFLVIGLPRLYTNTVAFTLFLSHWDALLIPVTYIGAALAVPLGGLLWLRLQARLPMNVLLPLALGFDLLVDLSACLALDAFGNDPLIGRWLSMGLVVWVEMEWTLVSLVFWGLAERVFRLREAKGVFGLIAGGEPLAVIVGGLTVPLLLVHLEVAALLWVSVASLAAGLVLLVWLLRRERERLGEQHEAPVDQQATASAGTSPRRRGYVRKLFALVVIGEIVALVVDTAFFVGAEARMPEADSLAAFLGLFFAVIGVVSLAANLLVCGRLLRRFGVSCAVIGLPSLLAALAAVAFVCGIVAGDGGLLFAMLLAAKLLEEAGRAGIFHPAFMVFYQPLPARERLSAQSRVELVFEPAAAAIAGVGLLGLAALGGGEVGLLLALASGLSLLWAVLAWRGWRGYLGALASAVARRRLEGASGADAADVRAVLQRALRSDRPGDVVYALRIIENETGDAISAPLEQLLAHRERDVRMEVLGLLERQQPGGFEKTLLAHLGGASLQGAERGATLRALAALSERLARPHLLAALRGHDAIARDDALVALMHHAGIEGVLSAGSHLQALLRSPDRDQRAAAAGVIGRLGLPALSRHLRELLLDHEPEVRRAAVRAAASAPAPVLAAALLAQLSEPRLARPACTALAAIGEAATPAMATLYRSASSNRRVRRHILDTLARIGGDRALELLSKASLEAEPRLALRAARALHAHGGDVDEAASNGLVERVSGCVHDLLSLQHRVLAEGDLGALLLAALEDDLRCARERLVLALLGKHPQADVPGLARDLFSAEPSRRSYALELLESRLPHPHRALVAQLLESEPPAPGIKSSAPAFLDAVNDSDGLSLWTRQCAAAAMSEASGAQHSKGDTAVMPVIEKVMVMRSVTLFADVPGELLAELAEFARELEVNTGTEVIREGETGSTLYVVVDGQVEVTRNGQRLAVIGARDVFGELAALDPEPRSATVTALEDVRLLSLDQEHLEALMADDIDILRGILRTLCRRLRAAGNGGT